MGLLTKFFGGNADLSQGQGGPIANSQPVDLVDSSAESHNIDQAKVLGIDSKVTTHKNADFESFRSAPIVEKPRYFGKREAAALDILAKEAEEQAHSSVQAYSALKKIDKCDTVVHEQHRDYQGHTSENQVRRVRSNVRLAEKLHGQRGEYERGQQRVQLAEQTASIGIAAIRKTYG